MSRCRALVVLLALALALPSAAFAQGAGDEQYQDPFGDEPVQNDGGNGGGGGGGGGANAAQDEDGLSDEPPIGGGDDGDGNTAPPPEDPAEEGDDEATPADEPALPNTGADPRPLAFLGFLFVLAGVGLRLRTIDPDSY